MKRKRIKTRQVYVVFLFDYFLFTQSKNKAVHKVKDILRDSTSAIVVVHNKIKTFLSNITFPDSTADCYKSTFFLLLSKINLSSFNYLLLVTTDYFTDENRAIKISFLTSITTNS